jgi:ABC-type multidrug transport system fused ATPase/permease subunit
MKDKMLIYISHRFSTILNAERILFFESGNVIMDGTHKELVRTNKRYKDMYENQIKALKK